MKLIILPAIWLSLTVFPFFECSAQSVGINNPMPASSAQLDVQSTTKGVLIPRMTSSQRTSIMTPVEGLLVYDTQTHSFWYRNNSAWVNLLATASIAYIYNQFVQVVDIEADITFDQNGPMTSEFVHFANSSQIVILQQGMYKVNFSVSADNPNQFAVFLNGVPVPGSLYGSGAGTQQNNGQVLFTCNAGDVMTLRNHSSVTAVFLSSPVGGTQPNVNASLIIERVL